MSSGADCRTGTCTRETCDGPEYHGQGDAIWCAECDQPFPAGEAVINPDGPDERRWCSEDCIATTGERQSVAS